MNDRAGETLRTILATHGDAVCDDPRKLRAMLSDLCPGLRLETNLLSVAVEQGVVADLLNSSANLPWAAISGRLVRRLVDNLGLAEDAARWTVETWAGALGRINPSSAVPPSPPVTARSAKRQQEAPRPRDLEETRSPGRWRLWVLLMAGSLVVSLLAALLAVGVLGVLWLSGLFHATASSGPQGNLSSPQGDLSGPQGKSFTNSIGMEFTSIQPGTFRMGSPDSDKDASSDEKPQHEVEITKGYYLGTYPVTRGQFAAFVKDAGYQTEAEKAGDKETWRDQDFSGYSQSDIDPVVCVSWNDAKTFCEWLSKKDGRTYKLPTEAEWEYACRAGTQTVYSFGDDDAKLGDYAWYDLNSDFHTHPVGGKKPNPWGLYDMQGSVQQWCADYYGVDYYAKRFIKDPQNTNSGPGVVVRGGSWGSVIPWVESRSAYREDLPLTFRQSTIGFRVVLRPVARTP